MERLIEFASRQVEHQKRMTTRRADLLDLLAVANLIAQEDEAQSIGQEHVEAALREKLEREGAYAVVMDRAFQEGAILIRTSGMSVGQINGIALYDMTGSSFGIPIRITARAYAGVGGVVNIDREVQLSGAVHDKGTLILAGYLGGRYAVRQRLEFSASITLEQSYDEIDGDSASGAELYVLLSALSGCPINQGIAVTGSVNQLGEIQPIGGVNEKIEGIFRICKNRGLTGDQGVMIPKSNIKNLMLSGEVAQAVKDGLFTIYAVTTVDQGIEVLTGVPAGRRRKDGSWTPGSISERVAARLESLRVALKEEKSRTK
jgi:predicted ATP-dependent protease